MTLLCALVAIIVVVATAGYMTLRASLPQLDGLEVRGYVHELYRHLAACDVAIVHALRCDPIERDVDAALTPRLARRETSDSL